MPAQQEGFSNAGPVAWQVVEPALDPARQARLPAESRGAVAQRARG